MESDSRPILREGLLQQAAENKIRCGVCERRCTLVEGGKGWCRTRINQGGTIYTLTYGAVSSLAANPVEKKPFYHFYPGSWAMTAGSWSCNFGCPWCQNWDISKRITPERGRFMRPEDFVQETIRRQCQGTSISFNEPTLSLEWSIEVFRVARQHGLYNTYVTNGYMTEEALDLLAEAGLDALNVDVKGEAEAVRKHCKGIDVERVWSRCRQALDLGLHLEITTLVIPTVNDSSEFLCAISERIADLLGAQTPWHVSAYRPAYRFQAPPTPVHTLERAWDIGKQAGLDFIYIGNVPGHPYDDTYCPDCGETLIRRFGFDVLFNHVQEDRCRHCRSPVAGVGLDWHRRGA